MSSAHVLLQCEQVLIPKTSVIKPLESRMHVLKALGAAQTDCTSNTNTSLK